MHIIHMLFRKNKRKRQHNRRGVSSIFGVIIGVSILITVIMPAQLYIRQVDSYYERQLKEAEERDIERLKEDLKVIAYPYVG